jgi:hypothetical protein
MVKEMTLVQSKHTEPLAAQNVECLHLRFVFGPSFPSLSYWFLEDLIRMPIMLA